MSRRIFCLAVMIFIFAGFRHTGPLTQYPLDSLKIEKFYSTQFSGEKEVKLINAQTNGENFLIAVRGNEVVITDNIDDTPITTYGESSREPAELVGDLKSWTNTAISLLRVELEKRGFRITTDAKKELKLAITPDPKVIGVANFLTRCILYLKVETGKGYIKQYEGNNISMDSPENIFWGIGGTSSREPSE